MEQSEQRKQENIFLKRNGVTPKFVSIDNGVGHMHERVKLQCFPLYSIIKAIGINIPIAYFSLDVEGSEYGILDAVFKYNTDLQFNIATVETTYIDKKVSGATSLEMQYLMRKHGFHLHKHIGEDDIWRRNDFNISCG